LADVTLPSLGESVTEGIVTRWMKQVGESVARDEPLYEISTDKVDSEMPAPASGILVEILVAEGDTVAVGARLAVISEDGSVPEMPARVSAQVVAPSPEPVPSAVGTPSVTSPFVRRELAAAGLTAGEVVPTGPGGRIRRADVAAAASGTSSAPAPAPVPTAGVDWMPERLAAVAFVAQEARYDAVDRALASDVAAAAAAEGVVLDATVFALRAAVEALAAHPELNGWTSGGMLHLETSRNIGIDVEIDQGLVALVLHDAQDLTLRGLAKRIVELEDRAATLSLGVEDLMGATFSISRIPAEPVVLTIPALRSPQVAALSVGAVRRQPVVVNDGGVEVVAVGSVGILGLAYDSTVVSPRQAAAFLGRLADLLDRSDWTAQL